jgi:hypothetical protein
MRRNKERHTLAGELEEKIPQCPARHRIDPRRRLVEKNHLRRVNHRASQGQPPGLSMKILTPRA